MNTFKTFIRTAESYIMTGIKYQISTFHHFATGYFLFEQWNQIQITMNTLYSIQVSGIKTVRSKESCNKEYMKNLHIAGD